MKKTKDLLPDRIERLTRPEPTIKIFNGSEYYITDTGETGSHTRVSVQLSVAFREKQLRQLKGPILGVFVCIALHINEQGLAWPSIALIAHETGYNKDTVFKCLRSLERMGFISRVQKTDRETGKFTSNIYQLFPKSRRFKARDRDRFCPSRARPSTVASETKHNQR
jgi:DNA-binding MarR family transcriptional regulator